MALPRKLKHFNVFYNGEEFIGQVTELTLPKLAIKAEEYRGGGMPGAVEIDMGVEKIELEHTYGGLMPQLLRDFGITTVDGAMLRFAGAYQRDDTGAVDAVEVVVRGRHLEVDPGSAKAGDDTEFKVKTGCSYYKLTVAGAVIVEIDMVNMIYIVNSKDRLAEYRTAIGR